MKTANLQGDSAKQLAGSLEASRLEASRLETLEQLKTQLKHFRLRAPQRSLASELADRVGSLTDPDSSLDDFHVDIAPSLDGSPECEAEYWDQCPAIDIHADTRNEELDVCNDLPPLVIQPPDLLNTPDADLPATDRLEIKQADTDGDATAADFTAPEIFSTSCHALDRWFPDRGIPAGSLLEVVCSQVGSGATHFCLTLARSLCGTDGLLVVIDRRHDFHPAALTSLGFDLQNVLLIRPQSDEDHCWALEQTLAHPSVSVVWTRIETVDSRYQRRWQLAAEKASAIGILQRPEQVLGFPSWSFAQLQVTADPHSRWLTGNRAYYASRQRSASGSSVTASDVVPNHYVDENWVLQVKALRIRGQFQQPTLRLELHNQTFQQTAEEALSWRPPHPNDPPATKHFPITNFPTLDRQLQEVAADVPSTRSTCPRTPSNRVRLDPRLADSTPSRRSSSAS